MILERQYYLDHFGVTMDSMHAVIAEALAGGGGFCDLYFEDTIYQDVLLRDGSVCSGGFHQDYGCGVRVLSGEKTGYAYSESTDHGSLIDAAKAASCIADGRGSRLVSPGYKGHPNPAADRYGITVDWRTSSRNDWIRCLERLEAKIKARDNRVTKVIARISNATKDVLMYNSMDELTYDTRPMCSVLASAVFVQDGKTESQTCSRSFRMGAEILTDSILDEISVNLTEGIDAIFEARRPKGGKMKVVMAPGASGILLHEAMGHAFEADFNRKGQSVFADRMGQKICRKGITIVDDGTIHGNRGAVNFDDEGIPGQRTCMVEDGVLTSFLHDRISAGYFGVKPTGNGRRESFRYNPIPRMRCTYMESGEDGVTCADLVASVSEGLYVDQFTNGQVKIGEGDFTFYVKRGFLIENGRLTMPVRDVNVIGNGPQALADIVAVGSDLLIDDSTWTCGKEQSVAVSCGMPSVIIDNLTVGGSE